MEIASKSMDLTEKLHSLMMNNFELVSALSRIDADQFDLTVISEALTNGAVAKDFSLYAKKWKLAPWMYLQLSRLNLLDKLAPEAVSILKTDYQRVKKANEARNTEAIKLHEAFGNNGIDMAVLKGNAYAHTFYMEVGYKRMNDFDMLIHKQDWDKIREVYKSLNYIPLGDGWTGEKSKAADFSHVGLAYISPNYHLITGSQWGLKSPTAGFQVDLERIWDMTEIYSFLGVEMKTLSPEHHLLHLILHLGLYKCGVRDCMDLYNLWLSKTDWDENQLVTLFQKTGCADKAWFSLRMCNLCCAVFPDSLIQKLKPTSNNFTSKTAKVKLNSFKEYHDIHLSYSDHFQDVEKNVMYFSLFKRLHQKLPFLLKILGQIWVPNKKAVCALEGLSQHANPFKVFIARLKAPYRVFAIIAQEIGWTFTSLIFVKLFVDLMLSVKGYFTNEHSYFQYLKSVGINPGDIKKVVSGID